MNNSVRSETSQCYSVRVKASWCYCDASRPCNYDLELCLLSYFLIQTSCKRSYFLIFNWTGCKEILTLMSPYVQLHLYSQSAYQNMNSFISCPPQSKI